MNKFSKNITFSIGNFCSKRLGLSFFAEKCSENNLLFSYFYVHTHNASRVIYSFYLISKHILQFFLLVFLVIMQKIYYIYCPATKAIVARCREFFKDLERFKTTYNLFLPITQKTYYLKRGDLPIIKNLFFYKLTEYQFNNTLTS